MKGDPARRAHLRALNRTKACRTLEVGEADETISEGRQLVVFSDLRES